MLEIPLSSLDMYTLPRKISNQDSTPYTHRSEKSLGIHASWVCMHVCMDPFTVGFILVFSTQEVTDSWGMHSFENIIFRIEQYARWRLPSTNQICDCMDEYHILPIWKSPSPYISWLETYITTSIKIIKCHWMSNIHISKLYTLKAQESLSGICSKPLFTLHTVQINSEIRFLSQNCNQGGGEGLLEALIVAAERSGREQHPGCNGRDFS